MNKDNVEGSVTVFLSCILLIIIVFTCTIIDTTRIRIAKLQALRALRSASTSVLANYDSGIAHEYGVFTLEKDSDVYLGNKIEEYADTALQPEMNLPEMNLIYQILYPDSDNKNFKLYDYDLQVTSITPTGAVVESDTDYIKLQILEYMKYQAPLLLIEPFLEKLELITKASKTTHYVKKKMEIADKASEIDDYYRELEKLIDGLVVSKKGNISYEDFFVKGIIAKKGIQKSECLVEMPDLTIRSALQNNIYNLYQDLNNLSIHLDYFDNRKKSMMSTYQDLYLVREKITKLKREKSALNSQIDELKSKKASLSKALDLIEESSEDTMTNKEDSENNINTNANEAENNNKINTQINVIKEELKQVKSKLTNLNRKRHHVNSLLDQCQEEEVKLKEVFNNQAKTVRKYKDNMDRWIANIANLSIYLEKNRLALGVIDKIEKEGNKINGSIEELEEDMKANKEDLIESTHTSIKEELNELKGKLAIPDDQKKTYTLVNNLHVIKDELKKNIEALTQTLPHIENLKNENNNLIYHMLYGELNPYTDHEMLYAFIQETDESGKRFFKYPRRYEDNLKGYVEDNYTKSLQESVNHIGTLVENQYATQNMVFNYGDMKTLSEEEKDKMDPRDEVKENAENIRFTNEDQDVTKNVNLNILPSVFYANNSFNRLMSNEAVDFESGKKENFTNGSLSAFSNMADSIKNTTLNLRDELYINEYIIGNFKSVTDNLPDAMPTSLSQYSKDDHFLNNEVEYVLRGSMNENTNVKHVTNTILGIRFVMNYLHILTNSEKRTLVMEIASSIAGWWTFGLGVYIIAALIMAAWSYAESCIDVKYLLQGKKVPFLKTSGDWYTSLQGIANGIIDETTEYVTDKTMQTIDAVSGEVKDKVAYITKRFESETSGYAQKKLGEIIDDAERTLQYTLDEIDQALDKVINDAFNNLREGLNKRPSVEDYLQIENSKLIGEIIDTIYNDYQDRIIEGSYSEIMSIKKEILEKFQAKIDAVKESVIYKIVSEIVDISNRFEAGVNGLIEKTSSRYKDITKKQIDSIAGEVKKSFNQEIDDTLDDVFNKKGKGSKIISLIPSFSYNDYLRLMLLIGVNDDVKLYRLLDLMQLNLQKNRKDSELILSQYVSGYNVTAEVSVNYLFFRLPFMPDEAKDMANNRYKFNITTSMTY